MIVLHGLSGTISMASAFAFAGGRIAQSFAINRAPNPGPEGRETALTAYLSARSARTLCVDCGGRGRRGLIARTCETCAGAGFVKARGR